MTSPATEAWLHASIAPVEQPGSPAPLDDASWEEAVRVLRAERAWGLAADALERGAVSATDDQRSLVLDEHRQGLREVLRRDRRLLEILEALGAAGVEPVVCKGTVAAHLLYADPALRLYGDVDLLVRRDDLLRTLEVLQGVGGRTHRAIPDARRSAATTRGVALTLPDGIEVDLHTSIAPAAWSPRAQLDALPVDDAGLVLGGRPLRTLAPAAMALHHALHLVLDEGPRKLVPARDLLAALQRHPGDAAATWQLASQLGLADLLARGVTRAAWLLPDVPNPLEPFVRDHQPSRRDQLWWRAAADDGHAARALRRLQLAAALGPADLLRYGRPAARR